MQRRCALLSAIIAVCASACTVYTPLQPVIPDVQQQGESELRVSLQPVRARGELSGAYSPAKHLVLTSAASWRPQLNGVPDTALFKAWRTEVGLGTYLPMGTRCVFSGLAGYGWGESSRRVSEGDIIFNYSTDYYSRYRTAYGQLGLLYTVHRFKLGMGYRLTQLSYQMLRTREHNLLAEKQWRHEPFLSMRFDLGGEENPSRWQAELSGAISAASGRETNAPDPFELERFQRNLNKGGAVLMGVGVVYHPAKWTRKR